MNSFGRLFRISIYGESHGHSLGIIVDGCPPGIAIREEDFLKDIARRKAGEKGTTPRSEKDLPIITSGVFENKTTGAPIHIQFLNENTRSKDYSSVKDIPRPGHADWTADQKFRGFNDYRGGGHFSGRLTLGLVAAGVIAKKIIEPIEIQSKLLKIGKFENIEEGLKDAIEKNDSMGSLIECQCNNIPVGLGEPFFDSLESSIAHIVFSIPAIKGIEFGAGFKSVDMFGSEMNDAFINKDGKTKSNNSGGINGGISNGNPLIFRIAVKAASSTPQNQRTLNFRKNEMEDLEIKGRHDLCIGLRVPPVLEAATSIVIADHFLINKSMY